MTKAAPKTVSDLLDLITKSGLYNESQEAEVRALVADCPDCPRALERLTATEQLTAWQADQLRSGQFILKLGDYRLLNESDAWDFGRAFLAEHVTSGQRVTLKLLSSRCAQDEQRWKEFVADLRKAARLNHPHLAPFRELAKASGRQFLIAEPEAALSIEQRLATWGGLGTVGRVRLLMQAAEALDALHRREIFHGCLSPRRVRMNDEGQLQITDIGVGRLLHALGEGAKNAAPLAPPSEWKCSDQPVACDLFALGQLFQKLEQQVPKRREPPAWWAAEIQNETGRQQFASIVQRLMAVDGEPFANAAELLDTCRQWCEKNSVAWQGATATDAAAKQSAESNTAGAPSMIAALGVEQRGPTAPAGPIVINTERRRRRPATVAEPIAVAPRRRGKVLIISTSVAVLVVLLIGAAAYIQSRRNTAVATAESKEPSPATKDSAPSADALETNPNISEAELVAVTPTAATRDQFRGGGAPSSGPDPSAPMLNGSPLANAASAAGTQSGTVPAVPENTADPTAAPMVANASTPMPADVTTQPPAPEASEPPMEPAAIAAATTTTPTDGTQPMPEPSTQPAADAAGTTASAGSSAPDGTPPTTETAPAPTASAENPLTALPPAVGLPDRTSAAGADATVLASIPVDDKVPCFLALVGGERVARSPQALKIENAEGGTVERMWDVFAIEGPGERSVVGQFALQGGQLSFRWTEKAKEANLAGMLENCLLQVTINEQKAIVGLRLPILVEPLVLDLDKGTTDDKWMIPNTPDPASCRFEVTGLEGPFPKHLLFPPESIPAAQGTQWILLGEQKADQVLALHLQSTLKRAFQLTITSISQRGEDPVDGWVKDRTLRTIRSQRTQALRAERARVQELTQRVQRAELIDEAQLTELQKQEKNVLKVDLERATALYSKLEKLEELVKALNDVGKVHFRVIYEVEGHALELLRTKSGG